MTTSFQAPDVTVGIIIPLQSRNDIHWMAPFKRNMVPEKEQMVKINVRLNFSFILNLKHYILKKIRSKPMVKIIILVAEFLLFLSSDAELYKSTCTNYH